MTQEQLELSRQRLTSPRAAGIAGILFGLLFGTAQVLIRLALPENLATGEVWLEHQSRYIQTAISLVPFAGIAFLWFIGVVRDQIGAHEDRLFSTVFMGSGLLYLAMVFVSAGLAGGMIVSLVGDPTLVSSQVIAFSFVVMKLIMNIYGLRMSGVFMLTFATIFLRTKLMPRWIALITYLLALLMLFGVTLSPWLVLAFPVWVFMIGVAILAMRYRRSEKQPAGPVAQA